MRRTIVFSVQVPGMRRERRDEPRPARVGERVRANALGKAESRPRWLDRYAWPASASTSPLYWPAGRTWPTTSQRAAACGGSHGERHADADDERHDERGEQEREPHESRDVGLAIR